MAVEIMRNKYLDEWLLNFFFFFKEFLMTPSSVFKGLDLLPKDIKYDLGILKV